MLLHRLRGAQSADELRVGVTSTQVGTAPPEELKGSSWCAPHPSRTTPCTFAPADPGSSSEWLTNSALQSETGKIWLPNLPVHGLNPRSPAGNQMPIDFPTCTVYFPGTYTDQVVLDGPTYFTSGIYYFENEVRVEGGASVVVGPWRRLRMHERPGGDLLRRERSGHPQHERPRRNLGARCQGRVVVDNSDG